MAKKPTKTPVPAPKSTPTIRPSTQKPMRRDDTTHVDHRTPMERDNEEMGRK